MNDLIKDEFNKFVDMYLDFGYSKIEALEKAFDKMMEVIHPDDSHIADAYMEEYDDKYDPYAQGDFEAQEQREMDI